MRLEVLYDYDPANPSAVYLSVAAHPGEGDWRPAFLDVNEFGERVVWADFEEISTHAWLRDRSGVRRAFDNPTTSPGTATLNT